MHFSNRYVGTQICMTIGDSVQCAPLSNRSNISIVAKVFPVGAFQLSLYTASWQTQLQQLPVLAFVFVCTMTTAPPAACDTLTCIVFVGAPLLLAAVLVVVVALGLRRPAAADDHDDVSDDDDENDDTDDSASDNGE